MSTPEAVLSRARQAGQTQHTGAETRIREEIRRKESGIRAGRASHDEYVRTCGEIAGLERALVIIGQGQEGSETWQK